MPNRLKLKDFVEDMMTLRSAGYTTKQDFADRIGISIACFNQRLYRARKRGLLPSVKRGGNTFYPYGE